MENQKLPSKKYGKPLLSREAAEKFGESPSKMACYLPKNMKNKRRPSKDSRFTFQKTWKTAISSPSPKVCLPKNLKSKKLLEMRFEPSTARAEEGKGVAKNLGFCVRAVEYEQSARDEARTQTPTTLPRRLDQNFLLAIVGWLDHI